MSDLETTLRVELADAAKAVPVTEVIPPSLRSKVVRRRRSRGTLAAFLVAMVLVGGGALLVRERTGTEGTTVVAGPGPSTEPGAGSSGQVPLVMTRWELVDLRIGGQSVPRNIPSGEVPWLRLAADGRASWYDGCNWGGAEFETRDDRLVLGTGGSTTRGCDGETTSTTFGKVLSGDPSTSLALSTLTLSLDDGDALVFRAVIYPVGQPAPSLRYTTADGRERNLGDPGGWVVVDVDATWCVPCRIQRPQLAQLLASKPGVQVVTAVYDDDPLRVREALEGQGLPWPTVTLDGSTAERLGINGVPTLVVVDPAGRVAAVLDGGDDVLRTLETILP